MSAAPQMAHTPAGLRLMAPPVKMAKKEEESMPETYIDAIAKDIFTRAHGGGEATGGPTGDIPLYRLYAVLALAKGEETTAKDVHDAWSAWMLTIHPDHRSLKPFDDLSEETQRMDDRYVAAIHAAAKALPS
jgi:hypothetical protein